MYALFLKINFKEFKNKMEYKVSEKITGFFVVLLKYRTPFKGDTQFNFFFFDSIEIVKFLYSYME